MLAAWLAGSVPAWAQVDLFDLVGRSQGGTAAIPAEGSTGRADIDFRVEIAGIPGAAPVMVAPGDDAVLVAFAGAELTLHDVVLRQEGGTQFALYVDGGTVSLRDCRIEGPFDTAIYVVSGSVSIENCQIGGAGYGIAVQPGAELALADVSIADAGQVALYIDSATLAASGLTVANGGVNAVYLQGAAIARLADLALSGPSDILLAVVGGPQVSVSGAHLTAQGGTGILAQDAGAVSLGDITVDGSAATGIYVQGGGPVTIDGFSVTAAETGVQLNGVRAPGSGLRNGAITMGPGGYGLALIDSPGARADHVRATGGDVGFLLQGDVSGSAVGNSAATGQSLYAALAQDVPDPGGAPPVQVSDTSLIATGDALAFAAFDAASVALSNNRVVAQGRVAVYADRSSISGFDGNLIVTAPTEIDRDVVLTNLETGARRFLVDGPTEPLAGLTPPRGQSAQISFTDLIERPDLDLETRSDIADFADFGAGLAGLELALAERPAAAVAAGASLTLAPPAPGWTWGARAFEMTLRPTSGPPVIAGPADFPLTLPPGLYELRIGGEVTGVVDVSADTDLALTQPPAPYMVSRAADGSLSRGVSLQPRADNALAALLAGFRPQRQGEWMGYAPYAQPRAAPDPDLVRQAVTEARARLPEVLAAYERASGPDDGPARNASWQIQQMYFALLGAFGEEGTGDWIFDSFSGDSLTPEAIAAVARTEMRLGTLAQGRLRREALARLGAAPDDPQTRAIVEAFARTGDQSGLAALAELHRRMVAQAAPGDVVNYGLATLVLAPPAEVLPLFRAYLERLRVAGEIYAAGGEVAWENQGSIQIWRDAGLAMAMLATHGEPADRALFDIPVPVPAGIEGLLPFVRDPARLAASLFGADGPVPDWRRYGWSYRHGKLVCDAINLRPAADRARIETEIRAVMRDMVLNDLIEDFWSRSADERDRTFRSVEFAFDLSEAHCLLNGSVLEIGGNAEDEERNKFENNDYNPDWWVRPVRARRAMESFGRGEPYPGFRGLAPFAWEDLRGWMGQAGADPGLLRAFELYHRLLNDGFVNDFDYFTHGAEQRLFRLRSEGGNGSISIAGQVNVRPLRDGADLVLAIQHNILSPDFGGLAAMITAPDREPYEADFRRRMFDAVVLERDGVPIPVQFERTTPQGVHLFRAAGVTDLTGLTLHITMRFVETTWALDYALYDSTLAILERRDATRVEVPQ